MAKPKAGALRNDAEKLLERWGVPVDPELLVTALTHRSFAYEHGGVETNERLEFLGDSVLSVVVTDWLYRNFPDKPESTLSKMRIATVSQPPLARTARSLGLGDYLLLGVGENKTGGRDKDSLLSDTLEALIGATYLSNGLEATAAAVLRALAPLLGEVENLAQTTDWKTRLQEYIASSNFSDYDYESGFEGPDHDRSYTVRVMVDGEEKGRAVASSKRHAENLAARDALVNMVGPEVDPTIQVLPSDR